MLLPSVFQENSPKKFFDFDSPFIFSSNFTKDQPMRTDIKELDDKYIIQAELPGISKEDINVSLKGGYLVIAVKQEEEKEKNAGNFIQKERLTKNFSRSFYVGNHLRNEAVDAKFDNGVLTLNIPKETVLPPVTKVEIQ